MIVHIFLNYDVIILVPHFALEIYTVIVYCERTIYIPEVNLAYVFLFTYNIYFTIFVTETGHGNDVDSNVSNDHPQIDSASSTDAEGSVDDVHFGKFFLSVPDKCVLKLINH